MTENRRNEPAKEKQIEKLRFFGCPWDDGITAGQASDALTECARLFPDRDPATVPKKGPAFENYRANGLSYRANHILKYAGIPATKAAVLASLKNGSLTPTKRPIGYGKTTHAELCRWVGATPHLFRSRKKTAS